MMQTIGVLDSGIGGLTFIHRMMERHVNAKFAYVSDSANVPYGNRSQEWMLVQMTQMIEALKVQKAQAVLMACNTATAETIDQIRSAMDIPIIGIEPYMRHRNIVSSLKHRKYALILTPATKKAQRFQTLQKQNDPDQQVEVFALPNLALLIEQLKDQPWPAVENKIKVELDPIRGKNFTHLILGCTHYGIIQDWLRTYLAVEIVDPIDAVIDQLLQMTQIESSHAQGLANFMYSQDRGQTWSKKSPQDFPFLSPTNPASL